MPEELGSDKAKADYFRRQAAFERLRQMYMDDSIIVPLEDTDYDVLAVQAAATAANVLETELISAKATIERQAEALGAIRKAIREQCDHLALRGVRMALRHLDNRPNPGSGILQP